MLVAPSSPFIEMIKHPTLAAKYKGQNFFIFPANQLVLGRQSILDAIVNDFPKEAKGGILMSDEADEQRRQREAKRQK